MADYRPETFLQFIRTKNPLPFLKWIWIGMAVILFALLIFTYKNGLDEFWCYTVFCIVVVPAMSLIQYSIAFKMYHYGRKAFLELKNDNLEILYNVGVYIRGLPTIMFRTVADNIRSPYQFDKADVILTDSSLILLGTRNDFGSTYHSPPVEIVVYKRLTNSSSATLLNWTEQNNRIILEINDPSYKNPFKVEFKNNTEKIKEWLLLFKKVKQ